jgi:uncharacterized repeat protein (TIGR02543 family)
VKTLYQWLLPFLFTMNCQAIDVGGIISSNTTWGNTSEPYNITSPVQVAYGSTLTINPGVKVIGGRIRVFGVLDATGNSGSKVEFSNVVIDYSGNASEAPAQIRIRHAMFDGGKLLYPTGNSMYGSLTLEDSTLKNIPYIYIWYPTSNVFIRRNSFLACGGISAGSSNAINVYIENNFFDADCGYAAQNWANYSGSQMIVRYNTFAITGRTAVQLPPGYSSASIDARFNYWGTTDAGSISALIFDKNDDLSCAGYIPFEPFLAEPDANTPFPLASLNITTPQNGSISGAGQYSLGSAVLIAATPSAGYVFTNWTGDASGSENPLTVTMDSSKTISAVFSPNMADDDEDGLTNYQEIVQYGSNPGEQDTNGDGFTDGELVAAGLSPTQNYSYILSRVTQQLVDARPGSTVIRANGDSTVTLELQLERSENLGAWTSDPSDKVQTTLPMPEGKQFFRFGIPAN